MSQFTTTEVRLPDHDCDIVLKFPSGKELLIQARPSNADVNYNGSLDIVLPDNQAVILWEGDEMQAAKATDPKLPHERVAKQLVTELI